MNSAFINDVGILKGNTEGVGEVIFSLPTAGDFDFRQYVINLMWNNQTRPLNNGTNQAIWQFTAPLNIEVRARIVVVNRCWQKSPGIVTEPLIFSVSPDGSIG